MEEAWQTLEYAGNIFESAGDKIGWAETRIGRLYLAMKLSRVKETLLDGKEAQKILKGADKYELLVRLNTARCAVYGSLGRLHRSIRLLTSTLAVAKKLGTPAQQHLVGILEMNLGVDHEELGNYSQALAYFERAQSIFAAENETRNIALVELNMAYIAQAQSRYRRSLRLLHGILERGVDQFPMEYLAVKRDMTECYLRLNRYADARHLAQEAISGYRTHNTAYESARSLMHLGMAEAELGNYPSAYSALKEAENIFTSLEATSWKEIVRLRNARIALKQKNIAEAYQEAVAAASYFESGGQHVNYAETMLVKGEALLALEDLTLAFQAASQALIIAQRYNIPSLRYACHLLLGQIAEAQQQTGRAIRRYQGAAATIERVQRSLTITLRPGFLEDKGEASRALIALYLRTGQSSKAFETLERAKSQVLMSYLVNREGLRWTTDNAQSQSLIEELNNLRAEHQWFYRLVHEPRMINRHSIAISPEQAVAEVAMRERRIRTITEQLYFHNGQQENQNPTTSLDEIQRTLNRDTVFVEFYNDGVHLWAFLLDRKTIRVHRLPLTSDILNRLLGQLQTNIASALSVGWQNPASRNLTTLGQRMLQQLYDLLIAPLELDRSRGQRLVIVPYGALHYLPFHLLFDGSQYLIEKYEIDVLPVAALATLAGPRRSGGALVLANTWDGYLPYTLSEAQMVRELFGGEMYLDETAGRKTLQAKPVQILHIAAHGEHRLDQPDLSYIQLADGQLYADDMFQQDLSYELVTLSACETGRANVLASDELIGLGRGFLYAGAGALLVSLWRVEDTSTLQFMERMYKSLFAGASKAAALREAQCSLITENRATHPAFWGAFQLIGNADPLSTAME
jgi:CHAT domain-containing protein